MNTNTCILNEHILIRMILRLFPYNCAWSSFVKRYSGRGLHSSSEILDVVFIRQE